MPAIYRNPNPSDSTHTIDSNSECCVVLVRPESHIDYGTISRVPCVLFPVLQPSVSEAMRTRRRRFNTNYR